MNPLIQRTTILPLLIGLALACFAFLPGAQAVSPVPDGCYSNFTTAEGCNALLSLTTGSGNTGLGWFSLFSDTDGSFNTGVGGGALIFNNGSSNTAVGAAALLLNTSGSNNTAVGTDALVNNTVDANTATGFFALGANTIGGTLETSVLGFALGPNTAIGSHALESNVDGSACTAVGYNALHSQVTGFTFGSDPHLAANTAVGFEALANLTGSAVGDNAINTAYGYQALADLTDGDSNVAVGAQAGTGLTTGEANTSVGAQTVNGLTNGNLNISVGYQAGTGLTTGNGNIFIGAYQGPANAAEFSHTYIGNIAFTSLPSGGTIDFVTIDTSNGLLGHNSSSRRYKENIKLMDKASEALYQLKPVTYRLKKEVDKHQSRAFGLIAEEVADVNPDLIVRNAQGRVEGVHYEMVNAMLLNEFLKEHKKVEKQEASITQLKSTVTKQGATIAQQRKDFEAQTAQQQKEIQALTASLTEQAAQIQKVSAKLEASKLAPQVVNNP